MAALPISSHAELVATLPSLGPFIAALSARLSSFAPPPAIFIHAPTNMALVLPLVQAIIQGHLDSLPQPSAPTVQHLLPKTAVIDLEELSTTRTAFDRALNAFSGWSTGGNPAVWNETEGAAMNWDGRTEGVSVKRVRASGAAGRPSKRARREHDIDKVPETDTESDDEPADGWALSWRRDLPAPKDPLGPIRDTLDHFHLGLATVFQLGEKNGELAGAPPASHPDPARRRWLIVNHAELLNEVATAGNVGGAPRETGLGMTFASTIYRLGQLSQLPITTVNISNLSWSKAREGMVGLASPELLTFPLLGSADCTNLLTARFAASSPVSSTLDPLALAKLFRSLASYVYDSFGTTARNNLDELAYLCAKFWPKWLLCVEKGNPPIPAGDTGRLMQALKADIARELAQMGQPHQSLSIISPSETLLTFEGFSGNMPAAAPAPFPPLARTNQPSSAPLTPLKQQAINLSHNSGSTSASNPNSPSNAAASKSVTDESLAKSLPVLAKWLLIASFYAGFNPVKSDVVHFVKIDDGIGRKGAKARKASARKPGSPSKTNVRAELTGGKAFPLERLLAIFEAIMKEDYEYASQSTDVLMQVNTLINLRLLQRVSAQDKLLDGVKLKCRLTRDTVDVLARSIGNQNWTQFLWAADA